MSISIRIASHLPYLRRYARAVTGSQKSGDAYVAAALEAVVADVSIFPKTHDDKLSLYKLFSSIYGSFAIEMPITPSPFSWEQRAAANLSALPSLARQAFLLVSVESFTVGEAAEVLDVSPAELTRLLNEAGSEIARQVVTKVMIVEDEPLIALDMEQMVQELGHVVTGIARTHKEAIEIFQKTQPKLVLADIQLADGSSGIDAMNEILRDVSIPVIFITAFPARLLTGERPEPTFLVSKPFNPDMVKALISQALFFNENATAAV
jgi:CheY-like chemotaxis protein